MIQLTMAVTTSASSPMYPCAARASHGPDCGRVAAVERQQLLPGRLLEVAQQAGRVGVRRRLGTRRSCGGRPAWAPGSSSSRTSPTDSGRSRPWRVTVEVSTRPSGPPSVSRAGAVGRRHRAHAGADQPHGHGGLLPQRGDDRAHVLGVGGAGAEAVEAAGVIGRRVHDGDEQPLAGEPPAVAHEEVAGEAELARSPGASSPLPPAKSTTLAAGRAARAHEDERLGDAGPRGDRPHIVGRAAGPPPARTSTPTATTSQRAGGAAPAAVTRGSGASGRRAPGTPRARRRCGAPLQPSSGASRRAIDSAQSWP